MKVLCLICLSVLMIIGIADNNILANDKQITGQWTTIQGSNSRTGRASISGGLSEPELIWELDLGTKMEEVYVSLVEKDTDSHVIISNDLPFWDENIEDEWGLRLRADLSDDGQMIDITSTHNLSLWGQFLDNTEAYQKISFSETWAEKGAKLKFYAMGPEEFSKEHSWKVNFEPLAYVPKAIVLDIDNNGINDIVVSHWYGVTVYDIHTGEIKYQNEYRDDNHGRHYGHFSSFVLPDGRSAVLVAGDFSGHIAVLVFEEGEGQKEGFLNVLWYKTFDDDKQQGVVCRDTINIIGPTPVADYDGDGQKEVVMNVFNEYGDERWHLMIYDVLTGEVKYDIPDMFIDGSLDITGDGNKELLGRYLKSGNITGYSELVIMKPLGNGVVKELWSYPKGLWSMQEVQRTESFVTHSTSVARSDIVSYKSPNSASNVISYIEPVSMFGGQRLTGMSYNGGQFNNIWSIEGGPNSNIEAVTFRETEGLLIRIRQPSGLFKEIGAKGGHITPVAQRSWREFLEPQPIVLKDDNNVPHIIIATANNIISCYIIDNVEEPTLKWQYPGRISTSHSSGRFYGLTSGDVKGDGIHEVIYATEGPYEGARVIARGLDGIIRWYYDLPNYSGNIEEWNIGMITYWMAGNFLDHNRTDIFISGRRSIMHSDVGMLIDTYNNSIAWELNQILTGLSYGDTYRGFGGGILAAGDYLGDGLEDIAHNYPTVLSGVAGTVGIQLFAKWTAPIPDSGGISIHENILVADLNNDGKNETLLIGAEGIVSLIHGRIKTEILWKDHIGTTSMPALAINKEERILGVPSGDRGFRALDAATGDLIWQVSGITRGNCVAVDINGDGNEEFIYIEENTVKARTVWEGKLVWEYELPKAVSNIVVADITGDNKANILVSTNDGLVYCIGNR